MTRAIPLRFLDRAKWRALVAGLAALVGACSSCTPPPPPPLELVPDPDAAPAQAQPLEPGDRHEDSLHRAERRSQVQRFAPDLDDWYRIEIPKDGKLSVTVTSSAASESRRFTVALTDERGASTAQPTRAGGRDQVRVAADVKRGVHLVWVGSEAEATGPIPYEIAVEYKPRPQPPPVRKTIKKTDPVEPPPTTSYWETVSAGVLELEEGHDGSLVALISGGQDRGLQVGQRGRFVEAGREIGAFTITEVNPKGSRVRVEGKLAAPVRASTQVQVELLRQGGAGSQSPTGTE